MSLNGGGEVTGEGGSPGTRGEFNDTPKTMSLNSRGFMADGGSPGTRGENKKCDKTLNLTFISYSRGRLQEIFRVSTKNTRFLSN